MSRKNRLFTDKDLFRIVKSFPESTPINKRDESWYEGYSATMTYLLSISANLIDDELFSTVLKPQALVWDSLRKMREFVFNTGRRVMEWMVGR